MARWDPFSIAGTAAYRTNLGLVLVEDCLDTLRRMPDGSIDLVITSPPYDSQARYGDGERHQREWYEDFFLKATAEIHRVLRPRGNFVLNYRSRRQRGERGTLQYELVFWLQEQGFLFAEDFIWGKPSPPPGRWKRHLKDAVEYCFQLAKSRDWQFYPDQCLTPARWDSADRARRRASPHNHVREIYPSGHGRKRVQAGPNRVRPSTLIHAEPEFGPNPAGHPARFPLVIPDFFIRLLTRTGQVVYDPFAGTCTTAVAAERLNRRWIMSETNADYVAVLPGRLSP